MDSPMARSIPKKIPKAPVKQRRPRRYFSHEFKQEAVQLILDGHAAHSVAERLGIDNNLLSQWKRQLIRKAGPAARTLGDRVAQLEEELRRVERERDILKKALAILGRMP
jgi:transposase